MDRIFFFTASLFSYFGKAAILLVIYAHNLCQNDLKSGLNYEFECFFRETKLIWCDKIHILRFPGISKCCVQFYVILRLRNFKNSYLSQFDRRKKIKKVLKSQLNKLSWKKNRKKLFFEKLRKLFFHIPNCFTLFQ